MPDPKIRRLPAALDGPLQRLAESREEITKAWLIRVLERSSLEEVERMQTDRIARELPDLVEDIVRAMGEDSEYARLEPGGDRHERAARLVAFRGRETPDPAELARDIAALQSVMIAALRPEIDEIEPRVFADAVERLASIFGAIHASALDEMLGSRFRELEWLANTDSLTGLYNVRYLKQHIRHLLRVHKRYGHPFAVALLDIDGLKRINDAYGHAAGDQALMGVAEAIRETVRSADTPIRMGGDEFCILAAHQTAQLAEVAANRLCAAVSRVQTPDGASVGVSVGVVSCPQHGVDADRLLELADAAMYRAKSSGERVAVGELEDVDEAPSSVHDAPVENAR
ncbi:MAG: diguanylate cyclase [Actinomycetota bacterium]|nr:diguanylate cyclase [Actinomycetota bacterium]